MESKLLQGTVIHGRGIGKLVGSPTANLDISKSTAILTPGVYISQIFWNEQTYYGLTHVGRSPTVDSDETISIEVHLMNFNRDIYGETISVQLYKKIREPKKFNDLSTLLNQIRRDCEEARKFFGIKNLSGAIYMDIEKHKVTINKAEIFLSSKEFDLLYLLYSNPDITFGKEQIYEAVWHESSNGCLHAVENTIFQIRKKVRPYLKDSDCIKTIVGYGYKFHL